MEPTAATTTSAADAITRSRRSLDDGDPREALAVLRATSRTEADPRLYEEMVRVRHRAAGTPARPAARAAAGPVPEARPPSGGGGIVEIRGADLDAATLAAGLRNEGCLLVRELIPRAVAEELDGVVEQALVAAERARDGAPPAETSPWYAPFEADEPYEFGEMERAFARHGDGLLTVDSPLTLHRLLEVFEAARIPDVIEEHFGERPLLSAKKSTLRGAGPQSLSGWHQDGSFLGVDTKAVNLWLALTPCGIDAPSIDIFDHAFDHLVPTGSADAHYPWSVGQSVVEGLGTEHVHRPVFEPGDAMFFDHLTLHRTGVDPSMTARRIAVESWFFAPSTYPEGQVPLFV